MKKKIFSLILASMGFAMLFTACGEKPNDQTQNDQTQNNQTQNNQNQQSQNHQETDQNQNKDQNQNNNQDHNNQNQDENKDQNQNQDNNQNDQNQNSQGKDESKPEKEPELEKEPEKHEHSYTWTVTKEPGCLTDGEETGKCACGDVQTRKLDRLGHDYGEVQTERDGTQYRICSRCSARDELTQTMQYTIRVVADEGCDFTMNEKNQILIYRDINVYQILDAQAEQTVELPRDSYIVRVDNLGEKYVQTNYCVLTVDAPAVDIHVGANPKYDDQIDRFVNIGDKMFNFLVKDATKDPSEYLRFDEIRKGKKLVYLDFFFVACVPCENMLRSQLSWYNNLDPTIRKQFLMIMIDTSNEPEERVNNHRKNVGIPDDIIMIAEGRQIYRNVVNTGSVPYGLYVDENGKVFQQTRGADLKSMIETYIGKSTTSTVSKELIADPTKFRSQRA